MKGSGDATSHPVFWLSMGMFFAMNLIVGYLLADEERAAGALALFFAAFVLRFVLTDRALHEDHQDKYDHLGRWIVTGVVLAGWALGTFAALPMMGVAVLRAFLVGGVILNVIKEEVPTERKSKFWAFALGAGLYALLLLML